MVEQKDSQRVIPRHISALDGLRALAIIAVIFHHCGAYYLHGHSFLESFASTLWTGVDLFFALSGFLITGILLDSLHKPYFFKRFYWRRGLRIWPLYYTFLVAAWLVHRHVFSGIGFAPFALYYRNFLGADWTSDVYIGQFWSLCVEEQFYLIWPLVIYFLPKRFRISFIILLMFIALGLRAYLSSRGTPIYLIFRLPFCHMDGLLGGAAVAVLTRQGIGEALIRKICGSAALAGAIGMTIVWGRPQYLGFMLLPIALTCTSLLFGGIVGFCAKSHGRVVSLVLGSSFLRAISTRSYAMYVFHLVPLYASVILLSRWKRIPVRLFPVLLLILGIGLVTYGLAWLSWRYFEEPILRLKKWEWFVKTPPVTSVDTLLSD